MNRFVLDTGGTLLHLNRADWGAGPHRAGNQMSGSSQVKGLVAHHIPFLPSAMDLKPSNDPAEPTRFMRRLQTIRPDLGNEVPYSFVVLQGATQDDAVVCDGRGPLRTGAHTAGLNSTRYGVAFAQHTNVQPVTPGQVAAFRWIGATYLTAATLVPTRGHNDPAHTNPLNRTECPGTGAHLEQLQPPFNAPPAAPAPPSGGLLRPGDKGTAVVVLQKQLNLLLELLDESSGQSRGRLLLTGEMDEVTVTLVRSFQAWTDITIDGIVGDGTRGMLWRSLATLSVVSVRERHGIVRLPAHPDSHTRIFEAWDIR